MEINREKELAEKLRSFYPESRVVDSAKDYVSIRSPKEGRIGANVYRSGFAWFYLNDELLNELISAGFTVEPFKESTGKLADRGKFAISARDLKAVQDNEPLFSKVMRHSLDTRDLLQEKLDK
jgi:hypothetical protein